MNLREAAQAVVQAHEDFRNDVPGWDPEELGRTVDALRAALAETPPAAAGEGRHCEGCFGHFVEKDEKPDWTILGYQMRCRECGHTQKVDSAACLRSGWPKCCGYTMTLDAPDERKPADRGGK